ncbi:MAG: zinc ribbon domain-containing protein [Proteobacteria bacterium]|nr:zinc ribbon domain-containing protein [Pseudomonadota bacterium]
MPLYGLECETCDDRFEELVSPSESNLPECPKCHDRKLRKQV